MTRADREWQEAISAWECALSDYKARLAAGRLDADYYKAGRAARRALRRCFTLAHEQRRIWSPGCAMTFY